MKFSFTNMDKNYARMLFESDGKCVYTEKEEEILEREFLAEGVFAVLDEYENLIGKLNVEFFEIKSEGDKSLDYEKVSIQSKQSYQMWLGWIVKDEFECKDYAIDFIEACIDYARSIYEYRGDNVMCAVPENDELAVELYKEIGFKVKERIVDQSEFVLWMEKKLA